MISESMRTSTIFLPWHIISVMVPTIFTIVSVRNISRKRPPRICLRPKRTTGDERLSANELAVFAEDDWAISPIVRANAGLRLNMYNIQKKTYVSLDPRYPYASCSTRDLSLKASYARMNQYVHQISESYMSLPTDMWMPVSKKLKPLVSDQVSVGAYYNLHKNYSFSVEGYYKWMNHLLDYKMVTTSYPRSSVGRRSWPPVRGGPMERSLSPGKRRGV